jgi:transposase InsO family protein
MEVIMPWQEKSPMSLREEFVCLALQAENEIATLCRRFGISRKTGYKWLARYRLEGLSGLIDRSRRPHSQPRQKVDAAMEAAVLQMRVQYRWGGRKIKAALERDGWLDVPAASTITAIIQRHHLPKLTDRVYHQCRRFESPAPNHTWQMDFKGPIRLRDGRVEPLTVLDDYSRFSLAIRACPNKQTDTVRGHMIDLFRTYGMPWRILADNGRPWGLWGARGRYKMPLGVWLMALDIKLVHSRIHHPQTCGKEERFHRTLKQELTGRKMNCSYGECQKLFDQWRDTYNMHRPHEALDMAVPADRYQVSVREFPEVFPEPEYDETDEVRSVVDRGRVSYKGTRYEIGQAFKGYRVAVRGTGQDHIKEIYFYRQKIATIDIRQQKNV